MGKKMKFNTKVERLDEEELEDNGFLDGDVKTSGVVSSFSFFDEPAAANGFSFIEEKLKKETNIHFPANDEPYSVSRYYKLRNSTARMLNEIKAAHPDVNVYMNTIVDEAIGHYYEVAIKKYKE